MEGLTVYSLAPVDMALIAVYFGIVVAIGVRLAGKNRSAEDYFLAGPGAFVTLAATRRSLGALVGIVDWRAIIGFLLLVHQPVYGATGIECEEYGSCPAWRFICRLT